MNRLLLSLPLPARLFHTRNDNGPHSVYWSRSAPAAADARTTARAPWLLLALPLLAFVSLLSAADHPPAAAGTAPAEVVLRAPEPGRFKELFQPFRTDIAALSPDGKYLAYSVREKGTVSVLIVKIDHPETLKARVQVIADDAATPMMAIGQREKTPGRINWMRWVTANRVVVETNHVFARTTGADFVWKSWRGAVIAFDADGANTRLLASPDDLVEFTTDTGPDDPFSTRRNSRTAFDRLVVTPDQPAAIADRNNRFDADQDPTFLDLGNPDDPRPLNTGASQPRTLRIFDLDPRQPDAVTLVVTGAGRATGNRSLGLYSLNTHTGKLNALTDDLVLSTRDALLDRQGRIRITLPNSLLSSFPFHYDYLGPLGRSRPRPLDDAAGFAGFSVTPENFFGARAIPLGFAEDPNLLYYASNLGRDTYGVYSLDLTTKQRGKLTLENPAYDLIGPPATGFPNQDALVFDRYRHELIGLRYDNAFRTTAWIRPEWQAMQKEFERQFPGRSVEIAGWDEPGRRFLVATEGPGDPGAFYVFDSEKQKLMEFVRRAPWVDANHTHLTVPFSYATKDGARISGLITAPRHPRLKPIPMVILCPDLPWERVRPGFQTDVQALADMGFAVVQLNGRGAWGLGLKQRESLATGYDLVQVEDIATAIASLDQVFNVNLRRVALMGRGHGGFIALRALQTYPDKFRCAIALDAPVDLGDWLARQRWSDRDVQPHLTRALLGDDARLKAAPLASHPELVVKPVLMLNYPGPDGEARNSSYVAARNFAGKVKRHGTTIEFGDLRTDYMNGLPAARAEVFDRIEEFLNLNVYDFNVKIPDFKVLNQTPAP